MSRNEQLVWPHHQVEITRKRSMRPESAYASVRGADRTNVHQDGDLGSVYARGPQLTSDICLTVDSRNRHRSRFCNRNGYSRAKALSAAATVASISATPCAVEMKPASNCDGAT